MRARISSGIGGHGVEAARGPADQAHVAAASAGCTVKFFIPTGARNQRGFVPAADRDGAIAIVDLACDASRRRAPETRRRMRVAVIRERVSANAHLPRHLAALLRECALHEERRLHAVSRRTDRAPPVCRRSDRRRSSTTLPFAASRRASSRDRATARSDATSDRAAARATETPRRCPRAAHTATAAISASGATTANPEDQNSDVRPPTARSIMRCRRVILRTPTT